jgi:large subunit ribosomal protein L6
MSRIGKLPVAVPAGVTVSVAGNIVKAKGKAGECQAVLNDNVVIKVDGNVIHVTPANETQAARMMWGTGRALVAKVVKGAAEGYTRNLELNGVGYKAAVQGSNLVLNIGFSHDIKYPIPAGIKITSAKPTEISITGADAQQVGQVAAEIRALKKPEPYKGKGIMYAGEKVRRKEGKKK